MEGVPRIPMLSYPLRRSADTANFKHKLKGFISNHYNESADSYTQEIGEFESLRASATHIPKDLTGCSKLKKYFCQLNFLKSRFPLHEGSPIAITFSWYDVYSETVHGWADIDFEMSCILYNIGALHTELGTQEARQTPDGMKVACTHFQCAAWAFQHLRHNYPKFFTPDISPDMLSIIYNICLGQAQECILEKSLIDNRKSTITAKVALQIVEYYQLALKTCEQMLKDASQYSDKMIKAVKKWKKLIELKISYYSSMGFLYRGLQSEDQQKWGERVTFFRAAKEKLDAAVKLAKTMEKTDSVHETLTFTMDVIVGKLTVSERDNEFIYHDKIPDLDSISSDIKGVSLVKGIPFKFDDVTIAGPDIFGRLVPIEAHEASSLYSEEKAKILRTYSAKIEEKNESLDKFLIALQLDHLDLHSNELKIPQELIDCCAALSVNKDAVKVLSEKMSNLSGRFHDVESNLNEVLQLLKDEDIKEKEVLEMAGKRSSGNVLTELSREAHKYQKAQQLASDSNQTLHDAMKDHVANMNILLKPLDEVLKHIPSATDIEQKDENAIFEMKRLACKIDEMRKQRQTLENQLRDSIHSDDITKSLVVKKDQDLETVFEEELKKHEKITQVLDQNLLAQENIIRALTEANANYAETRIATVEVIRKRNQFIQSLLSSYEAYDELLNKCENGIKFYTTLDENVTKLLDRVKSVCNVQNEEREQSKNLLRTPKIPSAAFPPSNNPYAPYAAAHAFQNPTMDLSSGGVAGTSKLKDYLSRRKGNQVKVEDNPLNPALQQHTTGFSQNNYVQPHQHPQAMPQQYTNPSQINHSVAAAGGYYQYTEQPAVASTSVPQNQQYMNPSHNASVRGYNQYTQQQQPAVTSILTPAPQPQQYTNPSQNSQGVVVVGGYSHYTQQQPVVPMTSNFTPKAQQYTNASQIAHGTVSAAGYNQYNQQPPAGTTTSNPQPQQYTNRSQNNLGAATVGGYNEYSQQLPTLTTQQPQQYANPNQTVQGSAVVGGYNQYTQESHPTVMSIDTPQPQQQYTNPSQSAHSEPSMGVYNQYSQQQQPTMNSATTIASTTASLDSSTGSGLIEKQKYLSIYDKPPSSYQPTTAGTSTAYGGYSYNNQGQGQTAVPYGTQVQQQQHPTILGYATTSQQVGTSAAYGGYAYSNQGQSQTSYGTQVQQSAANYANTATTPTYVGYPYYNQEKGQGQVVSPYETQVQQHQPAVDSQQQQPFQAPQYATPSQQQQTYPQQQQVYSQQHQPQAYYPTSTAGTTQIQQRSLQQHTHQTAASKNLDLLADIDFSSTSAVQVVPLAPVICHSAPFIPETTDSLRLQESESEPNTSVAKTVQHAVAPVQEDHSKSNNTLNQQSTQPTPLPQLPVSLPNGNKKGKVDPFADSTILSKFTFDVEKLNHLIEAFYKKSLNGPTNLDLKWRELLDIQNAESVKRSISVARCYPMKNRFPDILPYDQSRVPLPSTKDDYINASFLKEISPSAIPFIATQAPLPVTFGDFWHMIWHYCVELIVCLVNDVDLKGHFYWPTEKGKDLTFGPFKVTLQSCNAKSTFIERIVSLTHRDLKQTRVVIHLQYTEWVGNVFPVNPAPLLSFVSEVDSFHEQQRNKKRPVVLHCVAGVGKTGVFSVLSAALNEINNGNGILDLINCAGLACEGRKGLMIDKEYLRFTYHCLLYYCQDLLMKRGILSARTTFDKKTKISTPTHTRHPSQDFLVESFKKISTDSLVPSSVSVTDDTSSIGSGTETKDLTSSGSEESSRNSFTSSPIRTVKPSLKGIYSDVPSSLTNVDPGTFRLINKDKEASLRAEVREAFESGKGALLDRKTEEDPSDPLCSLDPLWTIKK